MEEAIFKRKRGRPKKIQPKTFSEKYEEQLIQQLFKDEIQKKLNSLMEDESESPYHSDVEVKEHVKRDGDWDVTLEDEIKYFDPELSYQITGYRPINMTQGLDFDPTPFVETARTFERDGAYTQFPKDSKSYNDYWKEEYRRCVDGYTVGKYRITGDHYFFLNFYRMQTINENSAKETSGRGQGFPKFAAKQYEFFHYLEICEYIGKDVVMLKARAIKNCRPL